MDHLLDELHMQENNYFESLVKSAGLEGAARSSSRSSLRAELERARAEQMRLQEAAREQQVQLEQLRAHSAVEVGPLEGRTAEQERARRQEAQYFAPPAWDSRAPTADGALDGSRPGGWRPAYGAAAAPGPRQPHAFDAGSTRAPQAAGTPPADLAAAVARNASHIARVEAAVDALAAQLRATDEKLARALAALETRSPSRASVPAAPVAERARKTPPSRALFRSAGSDEERGAGQDAADARAEAEAAHARLSTMSAKYDALKKKFARQTIREAELHGYLLQHGAPPSPPASVRSPAVRPASERRARPRAAPASDAGGARRSGTPSDGPRRARAAPQLAPAVARTPRARPSSSAAAAAQPAAAVDVAAARRRSALPAEQAAHRLGRDARPPESRRAPRGEEVAQRAALPGRPASSRRVLSLSESAGRKPAMMPPSPTLPSAGSWFNVRSS